MLKKLLELESNNKFKTYPANRDWIIIRWMLILRPAFVTATLGFAILLIPRGMMDKFPVAVIVLGTYILTLLYWLGHRFSGVQRPILAIQIAFDIFIITVIIHYTGGIDSSFVGFYFLSVICASLFFRRIVTFIYATLAIYFYVLYMFYFGPQLDLAFASQVQMYNVTIQVVMYSILIYFVAFLSSNYSERIFKKDNALLSALKLLKEARLDTSDIIQSLNNGLITVNMGGIIVYLNRAAELILGLEHFKSEGQNYRNALGKRNAELSTFIRKNLTGMKNDQLEKEIIVSDKEGNEIPLGISIVPLYDNDRSKRGIILNFIDLTEKKKLIEMLRQSDRMAAIGELSAAIAHEIRNPLASITNAVEVLKDSKDDGHQDSNNGKLLCVIEKESDRLERICSDFLRFARAKNPETTEFSIKKKIDEILLLLDNDPRNTKTIKIINEVDPDISITFDEDHFEQLLINIFINSFEALQGKGTIKLIIENKTRKSGQFVRLIVSDTGPGFPKESMGHMFEPFYSTKKGGTGLGLALVRKLVIINNGRVLAGNGKHGGAEIALDIPLAGVNSQ